MEFEEVIKWAEQRKEKKQGEIEKYIPVFVIVIVCLLFIAFYLFSNFIRPNTVEHRLKTQSPMLNTKKMQKERSLEFKVPEIQFKDSENEKDNKDDVIYVDEDGNIIPESEIENFEVIEEYRIK